MLNVNLFDNNFYHSKEESGFFTSTYKYKPTRLQYLDRLMDYDGITLFTDDFIFDPVVDRVSSRLKIAWLFEPPCFSNYYQRILEVEDKFDYILTYDENLLKRSPKYLKYIVGQSRVVGDDAQLYQKTRKISMIASHKTTSVGHNFRHEIIKELQPRYEFDVWGSGYRPFVDKLEPLRDYQWSICVMNSWSANFFTEVLVDCIRTGTIPIFWGCPNIGDYFNSGGIHHFRTMRDLEGILNVIEQKPEYAYKMFSPPLAENFEKAEKYIHTDDFIAKILDKL